MTIDPKKDPQMREITTQSEADYFNLNAPKAWRWGVGNVYNFIPVPKGSFIEVVERT